VGLLCLAERLNALSQTLEERVALLGLQVTDLEVCEAMLAVELERGLHPPDGRELSAKLDKART
jgi:hypothetical protein